MQTHFIKCIGCGRCFDVCPQNAHTIVDGKRVYDRSVCIGCGTCTDECYSGALIITGNKTTVDEVFEEIMRDKAFYKNSNGGVTISGGEPLLQSKFTASVLRKCKEDEIHTAVDTAGNVAYTSFEEVIPYTDLFLYDLKIMDPIAHKKHTGADNKRILSNLKKLDKEGIPILIRVPVIPSVNDNIENFYMTADFLLKLDNIQAVEPLAYHSLGAGKLESMGKDAKGTTFDVPTKEYMAEVYDIFSQKGLPVIRKANTKKA